MLFVDERAQHYDVRNYLRDVAATRANAAICIDRRDAPTTDIPASVRRSWPGPPSSPPRVRQHRLVWRDPCPSPAPMTACLHCHSILPHCAREPPTPIYVVAVTLLPAPVTDDTTFYLPQPYRTSPPAVLAPRRALPLLPDVNAHSNTARDFLVLFGLHLDRDHAFTGRRFLPPPPPHPHPITL